MPLIINIGLQYSKLIIQINFLIISLSKIQYKNTNKKFKDKYNGIRYLFDKLFHIPSYVRNVFPKIYNNEKFTKFFPSDNVGSPCVVPI